eukprot:Amastigsp_a339814_135.p4 type:complete len:125 gc:universal Amastigsp_a339814_135:120-494(+)
MAGRLDRCSPRECCACRDCADASDRRARVSAHFGRSAASASSSPRPHRQTCCPKHDGLCVCVHASADLLHPGLVAFDCARRSALWHGPRVCARLACRLHRGVKLLLDVATLWAKARAQVLRCPR